MIHATIQDRAQRDEWCAQCGYPFDLGQRVYVTNGGVGDVFCSHRCCTLYQPVRGQVNASLSTPPEATPES
jgi:hypothetical protein